ncbi:hypothetical protein VZT92_002428 [Zoarces viviparus]|uniref:Uncharacterized protein n=1 Tax=Zoarces viviparus TaxID=48416 RepID=A0AAW1G1L0_ZOAVI
MKDQLENLDVEAGSGLSLFSPPQSVCQLGRSVPRLEEDSIWDQRWREQMQAGRKQEPAPHLGHYRSGRTFLIAEDVKEEEEGEKESGLERRGRWEYHTASCVIAPKPQGGSERKRRGRWIETTSAVLAASTRASGFV